MRKKVVAMFMSLVVVLGCLMTGCGNNDKTEKLVIAVMASESSDGSSMSNAYVDLGEYIEQKVGIPVEIYEVGSYEAEIEALRTGKADVCLFSAFSYYLAKQRAEVDVLVSVDMGNASDVAKTVIITRADSKINSLEDLKGHSFAFVDPASTSGHIAPKYFLMKEFGVTASELESKIFSQVVYAGGHDSSFIGVVNGQYDAGACVKMILDRLVEAGMANESDYKVIAETQLEGNSSAMAIRQAIPEEIVEELREALIEYDNEQFFEEFLSMASARFCEPDEEGLAKIEEIAKALDLSEEILLQ